MPLLSSRALPNYLAVATVPETSTLALAAFGMIGLLMVARRKR